MTKTENQIKVVGVGFKSNKGNLIIKINGINYVVYANKYITHASDPQYLVAELSKKAGK